MAKPNSSHDEVNSAAAREAAPTKDEVVEALRQVLTDLETGKILLQRAEMDAAREPRSQYSRRLWELSLDYQFLEGEHDVFGDGTVMLFPTPGHTAGHQSAIVRTSTDRRFVLAADACYTEEHLKRDIISPVHWHEQTMRESMEHLRRLGNQAGTELVFGHDQEQWQRIEAADGALS